jgi:glycosyltransferase involved in cell wall biosynthesis
MRVGVYSRWIDTLGGGEQTLGAFAATLSEQHDVELITHEAPDWSRFQDTLGFDLADVPVRVVPEDGDHYRPVQDASREYDLFVNCSYLDHVRACAGLNVLQVFFPPEAPSGTAGVVPPAGSDGPPQLRAVGGLHPLEQDAAGVAAWSDGHARFTLHAEGAEPLTVRLTLAGSRPSHLPRAQVSVEVDGVRLRTARLPRRGYVDLQVEVPGELLRRRTPLLDVRSDTFDPSRHGTDARRALGVRVAGASARVAGQPRRRRHQGAGLERWTDQLRYVDAVGSYDLLLANSHFTQRWIAKRYGRASELLYPPVQVGQFRPGPKQQQIISVGRFFSAGHTKKQLEMIGVFRRLCDEGLRGWTYHLVGGTHVDHGSAAYLEQCRQAAAGYPVELHPDAPLTELAELYAASALAWNATGYGEDPEREPDRFEHFGMTTVEAMASGCVPLSYARAGQPEVVEQGSSGVLWETLDELAEQTLALTRDPARRAVMAAAAVSRSGAFTYGRFRETLPRLLADAGLRP